MKASILQLYFRMDKEITLNGYFTVKRFSVYEFASKCYTTKYK